MELKDNKSVDHLDLTFDAAAIQIVNETALMYGFTPSAHHVQINEDRDEQSVFGSADAEYSYYAIVGRAQKQNPKASTRDLFIAVASEFLQNFAYTFDVGRWLGIINAMLVGRTEYLRLHGHMPVKTRDFVLAYMNDAQIAVCNEY